MIDTGNNLIPSKLIQEERRIWSDHFRKKTHTAVWLGKIVHEILDPEKDGMGMAQWFPYCIKPKSVTTKILKEDFKTIHINEPRFRQDAVNSTYMIAMPCVPPSDMKPENGNIQKIINSIENEAFHTCAEHSLQEIGARVGMVIGLNTFYSMDSGRNESFREYVISLSKTLTSRQLAVKIAPFFWSPWKINHAAYECLTKVSLYRGMRKKANPVAFFESLLPPVDKCYMLAKSYLIHREALYATRKTPALFDYMLEIEKYFGNDRQHPLDSTIPYQEIRTTILHSPDLKMFSEIFRNNVPHYPQYVVSMDADFVSLKTDTLGLFSHYDQIVFEHHSKKQRYPQVMSTGYAAPTTENMGIITKGIELDRKIRYAISKTLPSAVYFPEPNFGFIIPPYLSLKSFSFMKGHRSSMKAESRQLIQAAIKDKLIEPSDMVFCNKGAIQTTIDSEWRTKTVSKYGNLSKAQIYSKDVIPALRGVHQSFADPQIWAHNIYGALEKTISGHMLNAIAPMKEIRKALNPFEFAEDMRPQFGAYSTAVLEKSLSFMDSYFSYMKLALACSPYRPNKYSREFAMACKKSDQEKDFLISLFDARKTFISYQERILVNAGYTADDILKIRTMAIDTGIAFTEFFREVK